MGRPVTSMPSFGKSLAKVANKRSGSLVRKNETRDDALFVRKINPSSQPHFVAVDRIDDDACSEDIKCDHRLHQWFWVIFSAHWRSPSTTQNTGVIA